MEATQKDQLLLLLLLPSRCLSGSCHNILKNVTHILCDRPYNLTHYIFKRLNGEGLGSLGKLRTYLSQPQPCLPFHHMESTASILIIAQPLPLCFPPPTHTKKTHNNGNLALYTQKKKLKKLKHVESDQSLLPLTCNLRRQTLKNSEMDINFSM